MYSLITDGAYSSSRDQGGLGFVILNGSTKVLEYSKAVKHTTNNKMELGAIILGLRAFKKPVDSIIIVSDSMYCIGCATQGWKRKKNQELWKAFDKEYARVSALCPNITWKHIKGHQDDDSELTKWNNYVDKLAVRASHEVT